MRVNDKAIVNKGEEGEQEITNANQRNIMRRKGKGKRKRDSENQVNVLKVS